VAEFVAVFRKRVQLSQSNAACHTPKDSAHARLTGLFPPGFSIALTTYTTVEQLSESPSSYPDVEPECR
jgi:hypothetical protein